MKVQDPLDSVGWLGGHGQGPIIDEKARRKAMKVIHGGVEKGAKVRTICGVIVSSKYAPYSQPVSSITCRRCRRSILATMEQTKKAMLRGLTHNPNYLDALHERE